jgi:CheY-like chemotaxis protein/HPt (histidine-containing phosphotransfer) domain-containing protein
MVTSLSWKGDARSARGLGINELLTKPLRRSELIDAATRALTARGRVGTAEPYEPPDVSVRYRAHVLLAEDNPVNVEVAAEFLTEFGMTFDVAGNGREAVECYRAGRYDLILMDCQMPELDGLSAMRAIRAEEAQAGSRRVPAIAVTANAFESDRVACLEAGMDDYLSKPFTEDDLAAKLARWLAPDAEAARAVGFTERRRVARRQHEPSPINEAYIATLRAERPKFYERISAAYLTHSPQLLTEMSEALASGNAGALRAAAHTLKSSSATLGADRLADLCRIAEQMAAGQTIGTNLREASETVRKIASGYREVVGALTERRARPRKTGPR